MPQKPNLNCPMIAARPRPLGYQIRVPHTLNRVSSAVRCHRSLVKNLDSVGDRLPDVINAHVSILLATSLSINALVPLPAAAAAAAALVAPPDQTEVVSSQPQQQQRVVWEYVANAPASAPAVHAEEQAQWWTQDADAWLELTTPAELTAFMSKSAHPPPAWPALSSDSLNPKLRIIEFYAGWCPACKVAAPGLAAVARDPQLTSVCSFARANVDRVRPLLKQLGISRIPTALLLSPSGEVLDTLRANGQVVRDAVMFHSAALRQVPPPAAQELPPPPAEEPPQSEVATDGSSNASGSSSTSAASDGPASADAAARAGAADGPAACSTTPEAAAAACGPLPPGGGSSLLPETPAAAAGSRAAAGPAAGTAAPAAADDAALAAAKQQFLQQYGAGYGYGGWLEQHYQQEVGQRLGPGHHYLDYTGTALYPSSLLQSVYADLMSHTYGNPHSAGTAAAAPSSGGSGPGTTLTPPPAAASQEVLEQAALAVLGHLGADPAQYQVVFTRSATEALKLVGEMFPWSTRWNNSGSRFIYTRSNHNSVLGIGAYAAAAGAELQPLSDDQMAAWFSPGPSQPQQSQQQQPAAEPSAGAAGPAGGPSFSLLAFPAQDNFAGVLYPLDWVQQAHAASTSAEQLLVLLDAAAFLPGHPLDLSAHPADFVAVSFYKMFGYPTGLGALVLRTELALLLNKVYFGGGSVALATPEGCWHADKCEPSARLSDGTPNFLGAAALLQAFDNWDQRGGMQAVEQHTQALSGWLFEQLSSLRHSNGAPLLQLYGRHGQQQSLQRGRQLFGQGAVFNFTVLREDGSPVGHSMVERDAEAAGLSLRSGCVCNPGACYDALGLSASEVQALAGVKEGCGDQLDFASVLRDGREQQLPLGSVRVSLGWGSTFEDVYALVSFLRGYLT